jgi:hypothetical protein
VSGDWTIVASTRKDRFALGEPIELAIRIAYVGQGQAPAPAPSGGEAGSPTIELRRDGGGVESHATEVVDGSRPEPLRSFVARGQATKGTLELNRFVEELPAGEYEAVVVHEGDRSAPLVFEIEELEPAAHVVLPADSTGGGRRSVLRIEARGDEARLLLAWPDRARFVTHDLGPIAPGAALALSVLPVGAWDRRAWVVTLDGGAIVRRFVGGDPFFTAFDAADVDLADPAIVCALAGEPRAPELRTGRVAGHDRWPELHLAIAGQGERGLELHALAFAPSEAEPRRASRSLDELVRAESLAAAERGSVGLLSPARLLAAAGVALSNDARVLFVALAAPGGAAIHALPWTAEGLGEPRPVARVAGRLLDLQAVADAQARVGVLARDGSEPGELALVLARTDTAGSLVAPPAFERIPARQVPPDIDELALRLGPRGERRVFGRQGNEGAWVLVRPFSLETIVLSRTPGPCELEFPGRLSVLELDPERGLTSTPLVEQAVAR